MDAKIGDSAKKNRTPVKKILTSYLGKQDFAKGQKGSQTMRSDGKF